MIYIEHIFSILVKIATIITILHVLMDCRQPAKTMAWVLVLFFFPHIGIVAYLFFGINRRRERLISERSLNQLTRRSMLNFVEQQACNVPDEHRRLVDLFVCQNLALPFNGRVHRIFTDGISFFDDLITEIQAARHHIHINLYIFEDDALGKRISEALIAKSRQGIQVRIVYDDVGCWRVNSRFFEQMKEAGIEVCSFLPVRFPQFTRKMNHRNHRKLIIIDGTTGYIGGMNIADRYLSPQWRDTMAKICGQAVYGLQRAFLTDWYFVDRTLISDAVYYPSCPTPSDAAAIQIVTSSPQAPYPELMQGFVRLIMEARNYVYIQTPYFMPTEPVLFTLKTAAQGGIDVRLIVPLHGDSLFVEWASRSYLREVVAAGVKVYLYREGFIHSKMLMADDNLASCGSVNIDFRSFENNFESNAFFYGNGTAERFKEIFLDDQAHSLPYADSHLCQHNNFFKRLLESLARLLAPLL